TGGTISVAPGSTAGNYTILTAGTLNDAGGTQPTLAYASLGRSNFDLTYNPNSIVLQVTGGAANISWNNAGGTGDGTTRDIQNNQNWRNGAAPDIYYEADNVTFNDTNNGHYTVNIATTVNPGSMTVNNSAGD